MFPPLTLPQVALLEVAAVVGIVPVTLRMLSELRWLQHVELVSEDASGRYRLTPAGSQELKEHRPDLSSEA